MVVQDVEIQTLAWAVTVQSSPGLDSSRVAYYRGTLAESDPVVVFNTGDELFLADGYHRLEAARELGWSVIKADVREGSLSDALRFAINRAMDQRGLPETEIWAAIRRRSTISSRDAVRREE